MSDGIAYLRGLARNNAWCNHRLLGACARLSQAEFEANRTGFFSSLKATLNHILIVDRFYVDALEGRDPGTRRFDDPGPCADVASLTTAQRAVDTRLVVFCDALTPDRLAAVIDIPRRDHVQRERTDRTLLHLFEHQIHHRGQAHAMLSATSIAPPQLDEFFMAEEAHLRADEFAALGFGEDDIWPAD